MKAGQASSTAKVIAASTIALAADPATASLVSPHAAMWCERLLSGSRADRWLAGSARFGLTRALWRTVESATLPGIVNHYWHRKRWIEARCRSAVSRGVSRVVVLGAGLDTLGLRLAIEHPALQVLELDHPDTQAAKQHALAASGHAGPANLRFVPIDLSREPLPDAATGAAASTLFIAEGLLMYLQPERVDALMAAIAHSQSATLEWIFSFMTRWPDGGNGFRPRSALIERWLAWRGEPFMWALAPPQMPPLLASRGLHMLELALTADYTPASTPRRVALAGENLVRCERR